MVELYENIKKRRMELGMTQTELANKVGYSDKGMISKVENGKVDIPQSLIFKFAKALKTTPAYLMGWASADYVLSDEENLFVQTVNDVNSSFEERMALYTILLKETLNRQLLDAAEGCTDNQKKVAIDMLNNFKEINGKVV
jgi:transcriptional regulator with XRE-family HTH domain